MKGMFRVVIAVVLAVAMGGGVYAQEGSVSVRRDKDRIFFEFADSILDRPMLVASRVVSANMESGYLADDPVGPGRVISFHRLDSGTLSLQIHSYAVHAGDSSAPLFRAVSESNRQPAAMRFELKPGAGAGRCLIDVTELLQGGGPVIAHTASGPLKVYAAAGIIRAEGLRQLPAPPSNGTASNGRENSGGVMSVSSIFMLLPAERMRSRPADGRVGYFTSNYMDFGDYNRASREMHVINRWRLEPREEDREKAMSGEAVEPREPIVFYIDPATPLKWVPYLEQAVNDWREAFVRAGWLNAISARRAPERDSGWSLSSCRAAIVYKVGPAAGIDSDQPLLVDAASGEIVQCHIGWNHNSLSFLHDRYMVQAAATDARARNMHFQDSLMGELIRAAVCREVGHALGLRDNRLAGGAMPVEWLRNKDSLARYGYASSIMSNTWYNYVVQPGDGVEQAGLLPRIGAYDKWAIDWGYRWKPVEEMTGTGRMAEPAKNRSLWWGATETRGPNDPMLSAGLGADPIAAGAYGISNLRKVVANLIDWTKEPNSDYGNLANVYAAILGTGTNGEASGQFPLYMQAVASLAGGAERLPWRTEGGPVWQFLPAARQRAAIRFLHKELFTTPKWLLPAEIFSRTGENPLALIGSLQNNIITMLLGKALPVLYIQEAMLGRTAYTATQLLEDLETGIFSELREKAVIDVYRRRVQNIYLSYLLTFMKSSDTTDIQDIIAGRFLQLQQMARRYLLGVTDAASRQHVQGMIVKMEAATINK